MKNPFDLSQKTCVVIGGAGLLGAVFSRALRDAGATVVIADMNAEKGRKLAQEISASFEEADATKPESLSALASRLSEKFGTIDAVVNSAYPKTAQFGKSFQEADVADMLADLSLHIGVCLSVAKAFGPLMEKQGGGSIVFLGSIYGVSAPRFEIYEGTSMALPAEYAAIKGGIISLARYFASLFGKRGIRVNVISPGGIRDAQPETFVENYSKYLKLGHGLLSPEDIAGALVYLFSDASKQVTGQNLLIDGGWTL
jgi:NAD(P)-dependent dehydrogenase (short-subunit alcohol dehydrogenase family)